ncbi:hypothetical protein ACFIOY_21995 [Bradyrhizobium sp. TZ2]
MKKSTEGPTGNAERDGANRCKQDFAVGSLCRLSALGLKNMPRQSQRVCTVVGFGKTRNQVRIKFAGAKAPQTLHASYLELIKSPGDEDQR